MRRKRKAEEPHEDTPRLDGEPASGRSDRGADTGPGGRAVRSAEAERNQVGPSAEVERDAPDEPTDMPKKSWRAVLRRTVKEFSNDELADRAAALTYYAVLSLFPALLVLVSLLGIAGKSTADQVLDNIQQLAPGSARQVIGDAVSQLRDSGGTGSVLAIVGLVGAVWSASGYVAAFIRASNAVYDMPEGRPIWKLTPLRLVVTVALMVTACAGALIVVFTGGVAQQAGTALGVGDAAMTTWSIAKWPVLLLLVTLMIALLYWASPNAKGRGFKWVTPGSVVALIIWMAASAGFAVYVAHFASYNKTYGALAGVIIFLVWLWITNLAILLGLEFDAEMARERAIKGGMPEDEEPYVPPRDTSKWSEEELRHAAE
ncbi:YihY/virulence factor BrkB family protein [Streptomyces sp. AM 4-1-1]|uniref:YihY/virulence factor BrkB family protein n=1 Tax=Streptomyces sp. AM 4-1-1 TaxID=3028710 RepID=UPI0023BA0F8B|nr:YihY/virulence factor BrkB family protein [Streptomyces sp. AM 4-1-1]WEH35908.1 YihY/virulence factor BrkB family protein [Streptomyces sp. AM 4-1-1]